jgi:DNA-binding LacI/PurR family transcriptional regulator
VQATGVLAAARAAGLGVPEDLSVVGFDDIEISAYAGLTTVRQPLFDSGHIGAELLLEALAGEGRPDPVMHELPLELIERSTTAPPRKGRT